MSSAILIHPAVDQGVRLCALHVSNGTEFWSYGSSRGEWNPMIESSPAISDGILVIGNHYRLLGFGPPLEEEEEDKSFSEQLGDRVDNLFDDPGAMVLLYIIAIMFGGTTGRLMILKRQDAGKNNQ